VAQITIVADGGGAVTIDGERVTLEPGQGVAIDRTERTTKGRTIFVPDPLKPTAQLVMRTHYESAPLRALSGEELARFAPREALALGLRGSGHLNIADLDDIAEQADQRGVEMIIRLLPHDE
jgi:hypothetical protein